MIDLATAGEFLSQKRVAVVGVNNRPGNFAVPVMQALRDHGIEVVAVGRSLEPGNGAGSGNGHTGYRSLADIPDQIDGVVVMVSGEASPDVVEQAAEVGVERVWLFKGLGGHAANSDAALEACRRHGMKVVDGACPLMFLEPVKGMHKLHRSVLRMKGRVSKA